MASRIAWPKVGFPSSDICSIEPSILMSRHVQDPLAGPGEKMISHRTLAVGVDDFESGTSCAPSVRPAMAAAIGMLVLHREHFTCKTAARSSGAPSLPQPPAA